MNTDTTRHSMAAVGVPLFLLILGCAAGNASGVQPTSLPTLQAVPPTTALPGAEVIDWRRPESEPVWIDKEPGIQGSELLFVGMADRVVREDFGRTDARMNARMALAQSLAERIAARYGFGRSGDADAYVAHASLAFSDSTVRAALAREWYTERYHLAPEAGGAIEDHFSKVYVLMAIPLADFQMAKQLALRSLKSEEKTDAAREILEKMEKQMREGTWPYSSH